MHISSKTGMLVLIAGSVTLVIALINGLRTHTENTTVLAAEIEKERVEQVALKEQLDKRTLEVKVRQDEVDKNKGENDVVADRVREREKQLAELEAQRNKDLNEAQSKLDEAKTQARLEARAGQASLKKEEQKLLQQDRFQQVLPQFQAAIVTLVSSSAHLGTGFYFNTGDDFVIVTALPASGVSADLVVKFRGQLNATSGVQAITSRARLLYFDKDTGLAFLKATLGKDIVVTGFHQGAIAVVSQGDKVYSIGTQMLGDALLENNVFDGDVSATSRNVDGHDLMQVSIPANLGTRGAPLINGEGDLIGILIGQAKGLERTSFAVPIVDLIKALQRMKKAR